MSLESIQQALDDVARDLPFAVEDYDAANRLFEKWHRRRDPDDYDLVVKWLFCYVYRYFLTRWLLDRQLPVHLIDQPLGDAFLNCRDKLDTIRKRDGFASFASVACKNTFINFCRRLRDRAPRPFDIDRDDVPDGAENAEDAYDRALLLEAAHRAIDELPDWLRTPVKLRLIENLDYDEMVARTGQSRATLRSYVRKGILRIKKNPAIAILLLERAEGL